jgi:hypothetical protein
MAEPSGASRRVKITIDADEVDDSFTRFPVLLTEDNLPSEMFDADGSYPALEGGADITAAYDAGGVNRIPVEVVIFNIDNDPANGKAEIWIGIDIDDTTDTDFYIFYNDPDATATARDATYGSENVWDPDILLVLHMLAIRTPFNTETGVNGTTETITSTGHDFEDGFSIFLDNLGGSETIGLTAGNRYFAGNCATNTFEVYNTYANAIAGGTTGRQNLTASGSGNGEDQLFTSMSKQYGSTRFASVWTEEPGNTELSLATGKIGDAIDSSAANATGQLNPDFSALYTGRYQLGVELWTDLDSNSDYLTFLGYEFANAIRIISGALVVRVYSQPTPTTTSAGTSGWQHHYIGYNDPEDEGFQQVNGGTRATNTITTNWYMGNNNFALMNVDGQNRSPNGRLDEVRFHATLRSDEYVSTSYNTQSDPGTFASAGTAENNTVIVTITITVVDTSGDPIQNARVLLEESPGGTDIIDGVTDSLTDVNGQVTTTYNYSSDQAVTGWARKSSSSPFYQQGPISGTITTNGLSYTAILVSDE